MSDSQRGAVLSLIFKKGDHAFLKNYRPISLTNTDYRLLTFTLSLRLQKVIGSIVGHEQTGYIRSRFIGTNARLIEDVIEYCNRYNKAGLILFLDFEKAFDTVEWPFMFKTLEAFQFGESFINWIKTLYKNPECVIKNNGYLSDTINLSRGIRQGCAISAMIFILVVEILSIKLKQNNNIKGISIRKPNGVLHEQLLSQYADDMSLSLEDETRIAPAVKTIEDFTSVAGPKLNLSKTEGLWIGTLKYKQNDEYYHGILFPNKPIRALGVYIGHNEADCYEMNWARKINTIQKLADSWALRNLTIIGKIYVIKSELLSKIIYCATVLAIPQGIVKQLNKIFYSFIWKTTEKLQRKILTNPYDKGGLKMVDVEAQFSALKAAWVPRYLSDKEKSSPWCIFPEIYFSTFGTDNSILKMNFIDKKMLPLFNIPPFYQEVIIGFNMTKNISVPSNKIDLLESVLWGNRVFTYKISNKSYVLNDCTFCLAGILKVKDLKFINNKLDQNYIFNKLQNKCNFFTTVKRLQIALKPFMNLLDDHIPTAHHNWAQIPMLTSDNTVINIQEKKSKYFYNLITECRIEIPYTQQKWNLLFNINNIDFSRYYLSRIKSFNDHKLAEFNYKFYHSILPNDKNLCRWRIQNDDKCTSCNTINDEVHMLFTCIKISALWNSIKFSNFFKVEHRNSHSAKLVYFNNELDHETVFSLSCLCYAIYTEWLDRKNNNTDRSNIEIILFIKQKLKYKVSIYKYLKWTKLVERIEKLIESF